MYQLIHALAMGGYARFVWAAYAVAFIVLFFNFYFPCRRYKKLQQSLCIVSVKKD